MHFQPLEGYPPIQNLISILQSRQKLHKIVVFSTKGESQIKLDQNTNVEIVEVETKSNFRLVRSLKYLFFYWSVFKKCIVTRPQKLMYFETLSAIPCILYKLMNRKTDLFVHYHEYTSFFEYQNGMFLNRINHRLEKKQFNSFNWISHTNEDRLNLFLEDYHIQTKVDLEIFPNYPTLDWINSASESFLSRREGEVDYKKLVYIGALSFQDTYIREICEFVEENNNEFELSIYSMTFNKDVIEFISSLNSKNIHFYGRIDYHDIPFELNKFDIGLILYKGTVPNFVYNAPNKLFEYYHCGLDVWYPQEMFGIKKYKQIQKSPKIFEVDFKQINKSIENYRFEGKSLPKLNYSAEDASKRLIKRLEEN